MAARGGGGGAYRAFIRAAETLPSYHHGRTVLVVTTNGDGSGYMFRRRAGQWQSRRLSGNGTHPWRDVRFPNVPRTQILAMAILAADTRRMTWIWPSGAGPANHEP